MNRHRRRAAQGEEDFVGANNVLMEQVLWLAVVEEGAIIIRGAIEGLNMGQPSHDA